MAIVDDTGYISEFRFWGTPTLISDDIIQLLIC